MRRLLLAIRIFFRTLLETEIKDEVENLLIRELPEQPAPPQAVPERPAPKPAARSEALTLLATLQREARFVDFIKESLGDYSDAQVGAAVRDVHRDCEQVLERMFALRPAVAKQEGDEIELAAGFDANRYRLTGQVTDTPTPRGRLVHHGWEVTKCELPEWSGNEASARVIAPAEVEVQ